ncbi:hypothetical protein RB195_025024 [Necator americanus]|uniref:Reverse transcriptase domain-containing protein n=1 Tax=Necator americanus TaxID=51031 RepID=A0ABR1EQK6_NECAM
MPLCLTFIDLKKAFDSVETEAIVGPWTTEGPGAERFLTDMIACRISDGRTSIIPKMVRRQVDMAVEEITTELVDHLIRSPSRCNGDDVISFIAAPPPGGSHLQRRD